jgi:hypothetical protein
MANTVTFSSTETDICIDGLWQYDIGQTLDIMGLVPTGTPEMHWAYSALADLTPPQTIDIRTMTEVTTGDGEAAVTYYTVDIPDLALSTADEVVGYIYDEGTGTGETIAVVRFYVEEREQPTDYAGVDDVVTLQGLINATAHNNLASKQGGTTGQYYHMTQAQNTALHAHSNQTGVLDKLTVSEGYLTFNNVRVSKLYTAFPEAGAVGDLVIINAPEASPRAYSWNNNTTTWDEIGAAYTLPTAAANTLGGVKVGSGLTITDGVLAAAGSNVTIIDHVADLPEGVEGDLAVVIETTYETGNYASITPVANPTHTATELIAVATISTTSPSETWTLYITDDGDDLESFPAEAGDMVEIVNSSSDRIFFNNAVEYEGHLGWGQVLLGSASITNSGGAALVMVLRHDLVDGDTVQISGTENYDGSHTVTVVDENTYTIGASFVMVESDASTIVFRSLGATGFTALPVFTDCFLDITPAGASVDLSTLIYSPPNKKDLYAYDTEWNKITHAEHNNLLGRNSIGCHTAGAITMPVYTYSAAIILDAVNAHTTDGAVEFTLPPAQGTARKYYFELWVKVAGADAVTFSAAVQWSGGTPHTFSSGTHYVEGIYNPIDEIWALKATAFAAPPP